MNALLTLLLASALPAEAPAKPNIILIMADDLGSGELGCYGQKIIQTPHVDALAARGIRFDRWYSGNAVCAPSRCVLMTGKHSGHAVVRNNREIKPEGQFPMPANTPIIASLLQGAGYATGAMGKWGLGGPDSTSPPHRMGFDLFYGYNCQGHAHNHYPVYLWRNGKKEEIEGNTAGLTGKNYSHDLMEVEALKFIRGNSSRPFFLYLPFIIPHLALQVPDDSLAAYKGKFPDPPYPGGKGYLAHPAPRAAYAAMVTRLDRTVGRINDLLQELKIHENTLVVFTSDNGPTHGGVGGSDSDFFQSAGKLRGLKGSLYEGGIRVPCVAAWPGKIKPATASALPLGHQDFLPTLAELAGLRIPEDTDGISILPTLLGKGEQKKHEYLYWEFPAYGGQQAAQWGPWKGVKQKMAQGVNKLELYNLESDPGEQNDVAAKHPDMAAKIEKLLKAGHVPSKDFPLPVVDFDPEKKGLNKMKSDKKKGKE
ncbi:MAG: arylsulfatase [Gemmataceae bacterium]|nr:arylsulfatase [Gemmataceae bacterium]